MSVLLRSGKQAASIRIDFRFAISCFLLLAGLNANPLSAQVYKWVDDNGRTHFSDKPKDSKSETVEIRKSPTADKGYKERMQKRERLLKAFDDERQESKELKAAKAEEQRKRQDNCSKARDRLQAIKAASYLYEESDDPRNPVVYNDEERSKTTKEAEKSVQHWCN